MMYSLTWLPEVLLGAGLKVAETAGWRSRGHGDFGKPRGVLCHHTVGPLAGNMPSLGVITNGRSDLPGPLAQLGLGRDGTWYVVAAGLAYHAGRGNWRGVTKGNSELIGIEAENNGTTEPWPAVQMNSYRHGVAALLTKIGADASMAAGHKEYALPKGRKSDPDFDMNLFRSEVEQIMTGHEQAPPAPAPIPKKDDDNRPTLRRGMMGPAVTALQTLLKVEPDSRFGAKTEAALRQFQREHPPLVPDGICGPKTWVALDAKV